MERRNMTPIEILRQPYARVLTPEPDGQYTAEILEFPGCVAYGDNSNDALRNLEEVAAEWISAAIEQGQNIPEPMANVDYSGRLVLRMSKGLHHRAAICAEREGVSLNQFIVTSLAEAVGERAQQASSPHQLYGVVFHPGHFFAAANQAVTSLYNVGANAVVPWSGWGSHRHEDHFTLTGAAQSSLVAATIALDSEKNHARG